MNTLIEHQGQHSTIQLTRLKNKSFIVITITKGSIQNSFFNKYEEKEAREFFELLKNINY